MDFKVYCDESGLEALTRKEAHLYTAIGGIWMPADFRKAFKENVSQIKLRHNIHGELKWHKISPAFADVYVDLLRYFFNTPELRFRVIVIESKIIDNYGFNNSDAELGFYKFYYQLLHHWIFDFNKYDIFLDNKVNRNKGRLKELKKVLEVSNLTSCVNMVQALPSDQSVGIQLADVLTGLVAAKFNNQTSSQTKKHLTELAEAELKRSILPTPKWEEKFNVFKINLQGGW